MGNRQFNPVPLITKHIFPSVSHVVSLWTSQCVPHNFSITSMSVKTVMFPLSQFVCCFFCFTVTVINKIIKLQKLEQTSVQKTIHWVLHYVHPVFLACFNLQQKLALLYVIFITRHLLSGCHFLEQFSVSPQWQYSRFVCLTLIQTTFVACNNRHQLLCYRLWNYHCYF